MSPAENSHSSVVSIENNSILFYSRTNRLYFKWFWFIGFMLLIMVHLPTDLQVSEDTNESMSHDKYGSDTA